MREGHDLVCGLKRLLRQSGSREAFRVAQETRLEVHSQVRPGTRTRVTHSDPIRHSATLPRPLLLVDRHPDSPCGRVAPPGKERTPPTPITPDPGCAWGPSLTWAGTCRASERLEPGRSRRLCSSGPLPPSPPQSAPPSPAAPGRLPIQFTWPHPRGLRLRRWPPRLSPRPLVPAPPPYCRSRREPRPLWRTSLP